jgi:hypothetical protein
MGARSSFSVWRFVSVKAVTDIYTCSERLSHGIALECRRLQCNLRLRVHQHEIVREIIYE